MTKQTKGGDKLRSITVPLAFPVTVTLPGADKPSTFNELTIRRMKAKDAYASEDEGNKVRAGYRMFAQLADVPVEVIEEIDMEDMAAVGEAVAKMMGKRLSDIMKQVPGAAASGATGGTS